MRPGTAATVCTTVAGLTGVRASFSNPGVRLAAAGQVANANAGGGQVQADGQVLAGVPTAGRYAPRQAASASVPPERTPANHAAGPGASQQPLHRVINPGPQLRHVCEHGCVQAGRGAGRGRHAFSAEQAQGGARAAAAACGSASWRGAARHPAARSHSVPLTGRALAVLDVAAPEIVLEGAPGGDAHHHVFCGILGRRGRHGGAARVAVARVLLEKGVGHFHQARAHHGVGGVREDGLPLRLPAVL